VSAKCASTMKPRLTLGFSAQREPTMIWWKG